MRKFYAVLAALVVALAVAAPASSSGPIPGGPAKAACDTAIDRQVTAGIQAGGGPKSTDTGPLNCDHFWQDPTAHPGISGVIGNGWPPPPFAP